ncbi:MAG: RNA polymerase sigma factor [Gammaproteobacteria bacterium]
MPKPHPDRHDFVADLASQQGLRLRRYLAARVRNRSDVPDMAQEIYLRLLRVERPGEIRSPEAYLFTVATHLIYEHSVRQAAAPPLVELDDLAQELRAENDDLTAQAAVQQRFDALERAIARLSPRMRTTLLMHRRDGFSLEEIGNKLGISRNVAKKYLAKALLYCRKNLRKE